MSLPNGRNTRFYYNAGDSVNVKWTRVGDVDYPSAAGSIRSYFSSISSNFTIPPTTTKIFFELVAGGGGRGGAYLNGASSRGGGGGGEGGYAAGYIAVTPGEILTIVVGGGGAAGTDDIRPTDGSSGTASSILSGTTVLVRVSGGGAGKAGSSTTGVGIGGNGGNITETSTRTILQCLNQFSLQGRPGYGGFETNDLAGDPGVVYTTGKFNPFSSSVAIGTSSGDEVSRTLILRPQYGTGGSNGITATTGYAVLYW